MITHTFDFRRIGHFQLQLLKLHRAIECEGIISKLRARDGVFTDILDPLGIQTPIFLLGNRHSRSHVILLNLETEIPVAEHG